MVLFLMEGYPKSEIRRMLSISAEKTGGYRLWYAEQNQKQPADAGCLNLSE